MNEYLNFSEIADAIPFSALLNHLNTPYEDKGKELKTETIIVNKAKNLFIYKNGNTGGGIINYYAELKGCDLRTAAKELKKTFLVDVKPLKKEIPTLTLDYHEDLETLGISPETAEDFEIGKVKGKSVLSGCIAFRLYGTDNTPKGYVGLKDGKWIFPKGSRRADIVYNLNRANTKYAIVTADILDCLHLIKIGYPFTVSIMAFSATDEQIELLSNTFQRILLIHKQPENIAIRLSKKCFVKAVAENSVRELDYEQIKAFF